MNFLGSGAIPLNSAEEKSKPGFCHLKKKIFKKVKKVKC